MSTGKSSPNFKGAIGKPLKVDDFPLSNIITDDSKYGFDANWAFCRFDDQEIIGARFGISRGFFGTTDYGAPSDQPADGCSLRVEFVTREGAYLWIENNKYKAYDVVIPKNEYKHTLIDNGEQILEHSGWPVINWKMSSDNGLLKIDSILKPKTVFILPDHVLRNSRFSMWLAICSINSTITIGGRKKQVSGTAFYDHPRISRETNSIPEFGNYNYVPVWFEDDSYFISYYSETADGKRNDNFTFGYYVDSTGSFTAFEPDGAQRISFDEDDQINTCESTWKSGEKRLSISISSEPVGVKKTMGTGDIPKTRKENRCFPLPFNCVAILEEKGFSRRITGVGLNEFIQNPRLPFK